ncbi:helix-turn-helix domain-containing protein [Parvibaculum sp.]|uniref:helix-turn-helix domain-containing protein n=1 Tax=Parvibaculum sp. TaxID=2024848 RepID=UPI002733FFB1|nr:helix-turn-helix domain-containing protein [Parvibaculum sp.]MDP3328590.1 DUF4115 domain-containing protein [Parvibaculum sp.]
MNKVTMLPTGNDGSEPRRRLHLRDITNEVSVEAESVGADLRAARLRRGEDVRSIAQALRIRRDQLEALEEGRHDALPARAYAVGFVRSYAEYLGLDSRHVVARYKAELDALEAAASELNFPDAAEERRLPKGTALIVALVVAAGAYGGWLLTKSTDEMMSARVAAPAPAPAAEEAQTPAGARGDSASAATPSADAVPVVRIPGLAPQSIYEPAPAPAAVDAEGLPLEGTGEVDMAALEEAATTELPPLPEGTPYGAENVDGRVVVRARRAGAWMRVEDGTGQVLIEQTFNAGDSYRAPSRPGVILVARDASAFEIMVDGQSLGLAGPPTLVLTGKSLDHADLLASMPKPAEAAVQGEILTVE